MTTTMTMTETVHELYKENHYGIVPWDVFPCDGLKDGMKLYIEHGIETGSALMAVLVGDLWRAVASLDDENWQNLKPLCRWIHNNPPSLCYGSREKVSEWISHSGASGYETMKNGEEWDLTTNEDTQYA